MKIKVLFFATLAQQTGERETTLELGSDASVADALDKLAQQYPAVERARAQLATAVDMTYVKADHVLQDGDELALVPPVSGG